MLAGKKRKRTIVETKTLEYGHWKKAIKIKSCSDALFQTSSVLSPVHVLARATIPFAFLDNRNGQYGAFGHASTRLFSAHIPVLEAGAGTRVLIARLDADKALYVVERVQSGVFALCRLYAWVTLEDVMRLSERDMAWQSGQAAASPEMQIHATDAGETSNEWWHCATISRRLDKGTGAIRQSELEKQRPRLAMLRNPPSGPNETARSQTTAQTPKPAAVDHQRQENGIHLGGLQPTLPTPQPFDPRDVLDTLASQYLDAVYLSKTSLAYFAKGPMSRARAAFMTASSASTGTMSDLYSTSAPLDAVTATPQKPKTQPSAQAVQLSDLTTFLRTAILPLQSADRKYRERIPEIVRSLPLHATSDNGQGSAAGKARPRKKAAAAFKPGKKDGMFPGEDTYVRRWWLGNGTNNEDDGDESAIRGLHPAIAAARRGNPALDQTELVSWVLRQRAAELRLRETLAQVILALEVLALEQSSAWRDPTSTAQEEPGQITALSNETKSKRKLDVGAKSVTRTKKMEKSVKKQDLAMHVELLVDKLCIWQTIDEDSTAPPTIGPSGSTGGTVKKEADNQKSTRNGRSRDALSGFCVEVLVPFFASRLPSLTNSVIAKLGGPSAPSPPKRSLHKPGVAKATSSSTSSKNATKTPKLSRSTSQKQQPDSALPSAKQPRKPLARTETESTATSKDTQSTRPTIAPRSATDSLLNTTSRHRRSGSLKREADTPTLRDIPTLPSGAASTSNARTSISSAHVKRFTAREVDLTALARVGEEKARRKRKIENDLRDAITALKRPDRGRAAGEWAGEWESRRGLAASKSQAQNTLRDPVLVEATPTHGRTALQRPGKPIAAPVFGSATSQPVGRVPRELMGRSGLRDSGYYSQPGEVPRSDDEDGADELAFGIPSSVPRSGRGDMFDASLGVQATPSKAAPWTFGLSRPAPPTRAATMVEGVQGTPVKRSSTAVGGRPGKGLETPQKRMTSSCEVGQMETPMKRVSDVVAVGIGETPARKTQPGSAGAEAGPDNAFAAGGNGRASEVDIYDALGWNDDDVL